MTLQSIAGYEPGSDAEYKDVFGPDYLANGVIPAPLGAGDVPDYMSALKPEWESPEFDTLQKRAAQVDWIYALLGQTFAARTTRDWLDFLTALQIPCAPVQSTDDLFDDPHLAAIGFFETVESDVGAIRFTGVPTWFSRTPGRVDNPNPTIL